LIVKQIYTLLLVAIGIVCTSQKLCAQGGFKPKQQDANGTKKDTAKNNKLGRTHEHIDNSINIWYNNFGNTAIKKELDTSITYLHRNKYLDTWQQDLGNNGSSTWTLKPILNLSATNALGVGDKYEAYGFKADSIPFFNTTKPYTEFLYRAGTQREQGGEILHTQNYDKRNSFSFRYNKYIVPGFFLGQQTNHDNFYTTFQYNGIGKQRLNNKTAFVINQVRQDENGGILYDSLLGDAAYSLRSTIPTKFTALFGGGSNIRNYYRCNTLKMQNDITVFFKTEGDSIKKYTPLLQLQHNLNWYAEKYKYFDKEANRDTYAILDTINIPRLDSVQGLATLNTLQNDVGTNFPNILHNRFSLQAAIGLEVQWLNNGVVNTSYTYNYLKAIFNTNNKLATWQYNGKLLLYTTGNAAGNYNWEATASANFKKVQVLLNAAQSLSNATYMQTQMAYNYFSWSNSFNKISNTTLGATAWYKPWSLHVAFTNQLNYGYIYWTTAYKAKQNNELFNLAQLSINKHIVVKKYFYTNIQLLAQQVSANAPINIPQLASKVQLGFTKKVIKNSLLVNTGLDIAYNTPFTTAEYLPFNNQFAFGTTYKQNNLPRFSFFASSRIKRFSIYLLLDEIQQPMNYFENRILLAGYPAMDFMARVGFRWGMVN
jgi:hypothetical protein